MALNIKEALVKWLLYVMMAYPEENSGEINYSEFSTESNKGVNEGRQRWS